MNGVCHYDVQVTDGGGAGPSRYKRREEIFPGLGFDILAKVGKSVGLEASVAGVHAGRQAVTHHLHNNVIVLI